MTRCLLRAPAVLAALLVAGSLLAPRAADAHSGGRAELYLADFRVEPAGPTAWTVHAALADRDSGQPSPGFEVKVSGTSPSGAAFGPVTLEDPRLRGEYSGTITPPAGEWTIAVDARGFPGGAEGIPLTRRIEVHLAPGEAGHHADAANGGEGARGGEAAHRTDPGAVAGPGGGGFPAWIVPVTLGIVGLAAATARWRRSAGVPG